MSLTGKVEERDGGLRRVSRLTRWVLSGGLVLSGGFAAVAGHAYAGRSASAPLQAPSVSPQQIVPQDSSPATLPPAPVVSGGS